MFEFEQLWRFFLVSFYFVLDLLTCRDKPIVFNVVNCMLLRSELGLVLSPCF